MTNKKYLKIFSYLSKTIISVEISKEETKKV
jgi:hypothetical protein